MRGKVSKTWGLLLGGSLAAGSACGGTAPADLARSLALAGDAAANGSFDASAPRQDAPAQASDAAPDTFSTLGEAASCLPRDDAGVDTTGERCESSRDCALGAVCCARVGEAFGQCSVKACSGMTPRQRCIADCECAPGRCGNAWPYMPYGDCTGP